MQPRTFENAFRASMRQRRFSLLFACHFAPRATFSIKRRFQRATVRDNQHGVGKIEPGGGGALMATMCVQRPPPAPLACSGDDNATNNTPHTTGSMLGEAVALPRDMRLSVQRRARRTGPPECGTRARAACELAAVRTWAVRSA